MIISHIFGYLRQHHYIHSFRYKFGVRPSTVFSNVLHGQLIDFLDEASDLIFDTIWRRVGLSLLDYHCEMDELLLAKDAFN